MTDAQPDILAIFIEAVGREDPAERSSFLDEACGPDLLTRERVETLLRAHFDAGNFLGGNAPQARPTLDQSIAEKPGTQIGPYKLLHQIGEGGMGVVYMAEQSEPVQRRVALKIIKPGMDTRQVIARFEAERQALAMMDHPNIAKVFDAGCIGEPGGVSPGSPPPAHAGGSQGRPYFVMELVRGVPITKYCDEHRLSLQQRLELFLPVCHAVQHAHQKGIIHRDLKPTNVLVAEYDSQPVPKVIDFGVAKATAQKLTERTMFTEFGQLVGTLEYMSPEQARLNQLDIDTRSDIYSLGVLLYELLTGATPFDRKQLQTASFDEMLRIIREEEPPKPSTRLSTSASLPSIAAYRHIEPARLSKAVRGELDWIVMKALEKERNRRYETANGFAMDVRRYLDGEAVQAVPPSSLYRLRKLARRHRWAVAGSALVLMCLLTLALGALVYAAKQRDLANEWTKLASDREQARQKAKAAQVAAESELYRALLGRSAAVRTARNPGYRREVWAYLREAAALDVPIRNPADIRNEVLACLGDPIGLGPMDSPTAERMPPIVVAAEFQSIIGAARAKDKRISTAVSADGRWLAIRGAATTEVVVWDTNGRVVSKATTALGPISKLAFSPHGRLLVAGCEQGTVVLSMPELTTQTFFRGAPVYRSLAIDPGGNQLATLDWVFKIEIWSLRSNRLIATMMSPGGFNTIEYSADGTLLLGIAGDGKSIVKGWPISATPEKRTLLGHSAGVNGVVFSPDSQRLASSSFDGSVRIWNARTGALLHDLAAHRDQAQAVKFSPDGRWLSSVGWDGQVILWDVASGERLAATHVPTDLWDVEFDSSGRLLAAVGSRRLDCWRIETTSETVSLQALRTVSLSHRGVDVAFRPGTSMAAILLQHPDALLQCDVTADSPPQKLDAKADVGFYTLHWDRAGEKLYFQSNGGILGVWDANKAQTSYLTTKIPPVFHAFTADSRWMAAPDEYPYQVRFFDISSDRQLFVLPQGLQNKTQSLNWSPDGSRLAVGGNDGDLAIWDLDEVAAQLREFGLGLDPLENRIQHETPVSLERKLVNIATENEAVGKLRLKTADVNNLPPTGTTSASAGSIQHAFALRFDGNSHVAVPSWKFLGDHPLTVGAGIEGKNIGPDESKQTPNDQKQLNQTSQKK